MIFPYVVIDRGLVALKGFYMMTLVVCFYALWQLHSRLAAYDMDP